MERHSRTQRDTARITLTEQVFRAQDSWSVTGQLIAFGSMASLTPVSASGAASDPLSRKASSADDPSKVAKMGERVAAAMKLRIAPEATRLSPSNVGISPCNRLFSVHQVHNTILKSFGVDGHDPNRPQVGICCEVRDPVASLALEKHNQHLADNSPLMPKVEPGLIRYEALACTHYNVALLLVAQGRQSPSGDLASLKDSSPTLAQAAAEGHLWVVLPENLSSALKTDICTWRNQDQNENQTLTDGELIRMSKLSVEKYLAVAGPGPGKVVLPLQQIVTAACMATPLKMNPVVMGSYCKFVCQMAAEQKTHLVEEFLQFWSASVDPALRCIPNTFFESLCKFKPLEKQGLLRMHMAMAMYCKEGSTPKAKPTPDSAGLFTAKDLETLNKQKPEVLVPLVSQGLAKVHTVCKPLLQELPVHIVRAEVVAIGTPLVRLLFGKALTLEVPPGGAESWTWCPVATDKVTEDKVNKILGWWAQHLDGLYPYMNLPKGMGLAEHLPVVPSLPVLEDV